MTKDYSTLLTWPPTNPVFDETRDQRSGVQSFLGHSFSNIETQETEESQSMSANYSDSSSIARFPTFHFNLHSLTALSSLHGQKGSRKVSMLLAILEVDGPDSIRLKKGPDAGTHIHILKMILGDEEGHVCKLTAWRQTAEVWGGLGDSVGVKRGDIVLIESRSTFGLLVFALMSHVDVTATYEHRASTSLSASPFLRSQCQLCYRTMPRTPEDMRLRPDLRLAYSDPSVRKVEALAQWFEDMAGLNT